MAFAYFYGGENEQFAFYRIPKELFCERRFMELSTDTKLLYGILLDRMELSMRNHWKDANGRIFIYYPIGQIKQVFQCSNDKAVRMLNKLDIKKGIGLIRIVRQGQGRPNKIYVRNFAKETVFDEEFHQI